MLTTNRYLVAVSPTQCAFCNKPFSPRDGYLEFWRTSDGRHFCSEFCADDAEEAYFQQQHRATLHSIVGENALTRA